MRPGLLRLVTEVAAKFLSKVFDWALATVGLVSRFAGFLFLIGLWTSAWPAGLQAVAPSSLASPPSDLELTEGSTQESTDGSSQGSPQESTDGSALPSDALEAPTAPHLYEERESETAQSQQTKPNGTQDGGEADAQSLFLSPQERASNKKQRHEAPSDRGQQAIQAGPPLVLKGILFWPDSGHWVIWINQVRIDASNWRSMSLNGHWYVHRVTPEEVLVKNQQGHIVRLTPQLPVATQLSALPVGEGGKDVCPHPGAQEVGPSSGDPIPDQDPRDDTVADRAMPSDFQSDGASDQQIKQPSDSKKPAVKKPGNPAPSDGQDGPGSSGVLDADLPHKAPLDDP
jgi:hypothetical protein